MLLVFDNIDVASIIYNVYVKDVNADIETVINEDQDDTFINNEEPSIDILCDKSKRNTTFVGAQKNHIKLWMCMFDHFKKGPLPIVTNECCWWCRNKFNTRPLGCPMRYIKSGSNKAFEDFINNINFSKDTSDYYETEGMFCSVGCIKAYIHDNSHNSKYKDCMNLLAALYYSILGLNDFYEIKPTGSWKLLKEYGGHLDIIQLRYASGKLEYKETINIKRPYMFSNSILFEERKIR